MVKTLIKGRTAAFFWLIVGALYLANLTFGLVELVPDNVPIFGNIDEGAAGALVLDALRVLFKRKR